MAFRADFLDGTKGIVMSKKDTKELYFLDFANTGAGAVLQSQSTALEFDGKSHIFWSGNLFENIV